ncbi:hypothetical protein H6G26_41440 [Nostoc sp. FACHB-888]|nr:hypothetical protein [Nostoc sp. FACHB-888]
MKSPISAKLERLLDKLLQEDIEHRYQSASEVLQDVQSQLPVTAISQSPSGNPLWSRISLKKAVSPKTLIQAQIPLPNKLLASIKIWNLNTGKEIRSLNTHSSSSPSILRISPLVECSLN